MDKDTIISEIKRTALKNGGVALGLQKFAKITGINKYAWHGKYWRTWSDALKEAGFSENKFNTAHERDFLIVCLTKLTQTLGRFPADVDLKLARSSDDTFPSRGAFTNLGSQSTKIALVRKYAAEHKEYADILNLLPQSKNAKEISDNVNDAIGSKIKEGFVYLGMLKIDTKKRYKIGKTNFVERRSAELSLQLPEKLELVHYIKTDDMDGIEAYWHKRFSDKNTNGEWFDLSSTEVNAFKRRKNFM